MKIRLDAYLTEKGLAKSKSQAQGLILSGNVFVNGVKIDKCGFAVKEGTIVEIKEKPAFVSRGGLKLEHALKEFSISVEGLVCIDVGASTGGFTDCLLKRGAKKVYAVDVGYGQLDYTLRNDSRVKLFEKTNFRYFKKEMLEEEVDFAVIDVSFISLTKIIPVVSEILKSGGRAAALIKPQFEAGKGEVGKGGIIRDESKHQEVIEKIKTFAEDTGFEVRGITESPIKGAGGNKEFLIYLEKM